MGRSPVLTWLTATLSPRPLGLARSIVGAAAGIRGLVALDVLTTLAADQTLRVPYQAWLPVPTMALAVVIVSVWMIAAVLFAMGWRVGLTGPLLLGSIITTLALDQQAYSNHLYLMAWLVFLFTLADAGAGLTISRVDRPVVRWPVLLIMMQISIVYGFSAITKFNTEFLSGRVLAGVLRNGLIEFPETLRTSEVLSVLAVTVIAVELFIAIFLWRARFRPAAFVLGLGLHLSITLLMANTAQLLVFSLEMLALYPLFLTTDTLAVGVPEAWRRRIRRFDLLRVVEFDDDPGAPGYELSHHGLLTRGAAAHTRILEHLVPWLWVSPLLRIPGISHLHELRHRSHERATSAPVGQ